MGSALHDDSLERALRQKLLVRTREDLKAMRCAARDPDLTTVVRLAHRLAGAAGALGLDALCEAARALEREGARGDVPQVHARLDAVATQLDLAAGPAAH